MNFGLRTRAIVEPLFERQFGVDLGVTAVGSMLAIRPLTPQKPLQRAYQRNPEAIALWLEQTYPALKTRIEGDYVESTEDKLSLHFLPCYAPELTPDVLIDNSLMFATIRIWCDHSSMLRLSPMVVTAESYGPGIS